LDEKARRLGDRRDGRLLRDLDSMHYIVPLLYPNRCDNEAFISEKIDLTKTNEYLEKRNAENPAYRYNLFQLIVAAAMKTLTLRPKMNRFIAHRNIYQRNEVSASFVVKKEFADNGGEALAFLHTVPSDTLDTIHQKIYDQISFCRGDAVDSSTDNMDILNSMPRIVSRTLVDGIRFLDVHGWVPQPLIDTDPYYSSVVLTNLGSIGLKMGYHHLTNWGTNSVFIAVGEKKLSPEFDPDGRVTMHPTVELGLTIDERIADGYYYSKTVRLLRTLLEHPELLETRLDEKVEY
jgi:hypothetical protein